MKKDMDKIILESRNEISLLIDALEIVIKSRDSEEDEKIAAAELQELLISMHYSW